MKAEMLEISTWERGIICWQWYGHGHSTSEHSLSVWLYKQRRK